MCLGLWNFWKFNISENFPEISGTKMCIIFFEFVDIHGSRAKNKLNIMHKVKTQRSGELFVKNHIKNMVIYYFLYG